MHNTSIKGTFSSYFVMFLGRETLKGHSQLPQKAYKYSVRAVARFLNIWQPKACLHHPYIESLPTV